MVFLLGFISSRLSYGQNKNNTASLPKSNFVSKYIKATADTLLIDSMGFALESFQLDGLPETDYELLPFSGKIVFKQKTQIKDSLKISYRKLPISFANPYYNKPQSLIEENVLIAPRGYNAAINKGFGANLIDANALDYSGNYGRSLSVGNNQNVILNSQFNLQLSGYLLDSIKIDAAITDNNIPFQPEGNTQRLQEFDRIFITFSKNQHKLTLGDFNIERPKSYFLSYNKRVQGIQYEGHTNLKKRISNKISLSGSMAKGQFTRNIFQGIEGNQGPYKLQGENGEQYFIVLAGSERVFIDGELMVRGEDQDYIINYNLGEITFMPRRLITKDKRIQVDFEYQARNYLNTLIEVKDEVQIGEKLSLRFNYYGNQDAKRQAYNQVLSDDQKRFLSTIGDSIQHAYYTTEKLDTFAANKILYEKRDTIIDGLTYNDIYSYSTNPDAILYNLGFSYVGEGKGDYIISNLNTNGRSYQWTPPSNGNKQGNYEPKVLLITPKKLQIISTAATYKIDSFKKMDIEWAGSNYAPNTFSSIHNNTHWGNAARVVYSEQRILSKDSINNPKLKLQTQVSYEFVDDRFEAIAPYRNVEFNRDWNIIEPQNRANEQLLDLSTGIKSENSLLQYRFTNYTRGIDYKGNRHLIEGKYTKGVLNIGTFSSLLTSNSFQYSSTFIRPQFFIESYTGAKKKHLIGFKFEKEANALKDRTSDTLSATAYNFDISRLYYRAKTGNGIDLELAYNYRRDFLPSKKEFLLNNAGHTIDATVNITKWKQHQLSAHGSYRILKVYIPNTVNLKDEQTLLSRINYTGNIKKGFFTPNLLYDFGTGQEQKRQFTFVGVPTGQGTHFWVDYNNDGIQQANEFEIALYPDQKRFIKMITPTNEYVKVNFANFNFSFQLMPELLWRQLEHKNNTQKLLSRFSNQFNVQINNRILQSEGLKVFNPLQSNYTDTSIVSALTNLANTLYFNRASSKWGIDYTISLNTSQALLTYGLETTDWLRHQEKIRWILNKQLTFIITGMQSNRRFLSPITDGRSYDISYQGIEPSAVLLYGTKFRLTPAYKYESRTNSKTWGGQQALIHNMSLEGRWSTPNTGNLIARAAYNKISFNGAENTALSLTMLETLSKGSNWLWYLNWTTRLNKTIEFSIEYDGRKPGENKAIHSGSMSLRAVL